MYRILCDSYVFYDPRLFDLFVLEPELTQKKNEPGELSFTIPKEHPHCGVLEKLRSRIKVYRDDTLIWVGRAIEDERDLYENRKIVAEGSLAYLLDSILRPFDMDDTATDVWQYILTQHNTQVNLNQRLGLGTCDLAGSVSIATKDYLSAWQVLKASLLDPLGGYLIIRFDENENPILDYLADVPDTSTQRIEFGENLIDLVLSKNASEAYTACVPLGASLKDIDPESESDARLTIASVNEGQDYLIDTALATEYGVIFAPSGLTTWDEITDPTILMNKGHDWLSSTGARFKQTIKLSAVDLHKGVFTKGTKTDSSVRSIKLPEQAFELLKEHRKWQRKKRIAMGDRWVDSDRIFAQDDGTPVHPDSITGWFHDFISRTDLPQISIHSLRHTNITLLLAAGIPLKTVSYRAGHAQTSTTANIYSHAIRTADEKAAEVLENIVKQSEYTR